MEASTPVVKVPFSKRVIAVALAGLVAVALQKIAPGYHPDAVIQNLVTLAIASAAGYAVTEERDYLTKALAYLANKGK